jgi:hypothetical protein
LRKLILSLFLFFSFSLLAYNQVIKGTIKDKKTDNVICFASVYFDITFVGTQSDVNGNFELDISKNSSMPITVSCVGYYSITQPISTDKPLIIYLTPKAYDVEGVVVSSKSRVGERNTNLALFKDIFLGTTYNGRHSLILNEQDITFNYDSDDDTLKAFASKPMLIYNKALGYKLTYFLDRFEYYKKDSTFFYTGSTIFTEDLINDKSHKQSYQRKRESTYLGSRMHFFRALWANKLTAAGFTVKDPMSQNLSYENIVVLENRSPFGPVSTFTKSLSYKKSLEVGFYPNTTKIVFLKPKVYFDRNGYFDPIGIFMEGDMALQRIGDMLPYDYKSTINNQ